MLYFIFWVVVLLGSILAFVLTIVMNKPKRPKPTTPAEPTMNEPLLNEQAVADEAVIEEGFGDDASPSEAVVADDFAAFDDEFK